LYSFQAVVTPSGNVSFELTAQKVHPMSKLLRAWELKGGVSAQVTAIEIERPDGLTQKMVVRRHGLADLERNPHIAEDEFRLLQLLQAAGLPVPAPYYVDLPGEIFATPCIIIEYIEGETEFAPSDLDTFLSQFAVNLVRIHSITTASMDLSFLPKQEELYANMFSERPTKMDESLDEGRIWDAVSVAWPLHGRNADVLLHGDYWPGNVLWRDGRLVGIIDWEDAELGDPLEDVANSRLEILWAFGVEAMHSFTEKYQSVAGIDFTDLPYWDLFVASWTAPRISEWAANDVSEKAMREKHKFFAMQAFEKLGL